jgi:hypothetical protein
MKRLIPAEELDRRGISMVDSLLAEGPVYITRDDHIEYVVMGRTVYEDVLEDQAEAEAARVRASMEELASGDRISMTAEELIRELRLDD